MIVRQRDAARDFEPTRHYGEWRQRCPLHLESDHDPPFYVLSRFDDIVDALRHPEQWRNGDRPGVFYQERGVLGTTDEPDQLLARIDGIVLDGEPERNDSFVLHGPTRLPIRFTKR